MFYVRACVPYVPNNNWTAILIVTQKNQMVRYILKILVQILDLRTYHNNCVCILHTSIALFAFNIIVYEYSIENKQIESIFIGLLLLRLLNYRFCIAYSIQFPLFVSHSTIHGTGPLTYGYSLVCQFVILQIRRCFNKNILYDTFTENKGIAIKDLINCGQQLLSLILIWSIWCMWTTERLYKILKNEAISRLTPEIYWVF